MARQGERFARPGRCGDRPAACRDSVTVKGNMRHGPTFPRIWKYLNPAPVGYRAAGELERQSYSALWAAGGLAVIFLPRAQFVTWGLRHASATHRDDDLLPRPTRERRSAAGHRDGDHPWRESSRRKASDVLSPAPHRYRRQDRMVVLGSHYVAHLCRQLLERKGFGDEVDIFVEHAIMYDSIAAEARSKDHA